MDFKVPSTIPQDLLLIQDLIGTIPPIGEKHSTDSLDSSDDSIASTDSEAESENEVEADLAPRDDDSGISQATSDSGSPSDSELDTSSSSESDGEREHEAPQRQITKGDIEDEESGVTAATTYLQTKNEIIDANIMVPTISEIGTCDKLEKVGEIMSIVGNVVVVRGLPVDHVNPLSRRALDAESLLVFDDRRVLGYIYETFGPTSQPLYQVKFDQRYPLDTGKVWLSREVFHVPQQSHFVFVDQLKKLRGSDASNIHDEEPADDEVEFSDDEKEAAFRAQHRKRRGRSISFSRQSTPALSRIDVDDMDTYRGSNPYEAHGPYDDDYHVTGPSRPPPVPYDDPYAEVPTSDARVHPPIEAHGKIREEPNSDIGGDGPKASRRRVSSRGTRGKGGTSRRARHNVASQRSIDPSHGLSFMAASRMAECATEYGQIGGGISPHPHVQSASGAWRSSETNNVHGYQQPLIQPHINPRFASAFGFGLSSGVASGPMIPWASRNVQNHAFSPHPGHWADTWTMHGSAGSEGEGDTYRPM